MRTVSAARTCSQARCESIWLVVLMTVVASALEDDPHITKFTASDAQQYAQTSFRLASPV